MSVAYEQQRIRTGTAGQRAAVVARRFVPFALVGGLSVGIQWVRFGMKTPSLVDDWFGVTYSRPALHALLHGRYSSAGVDFAGRIRPGYTAVWNYAQWHLPTGPSIPVAAAWGVVRVALFLIAAWVLARWILARRSLASPHLVWLAPLAVALTPQIAVDLARYGPGEPMMIAGLIIGLALIGTGARGLLVGGSSTRDRTLAALVVAAGYVIYLIGVYSKEASLCLLVFIPFFVKWLGPRLRAELMRGRKARSMLALLGVLIIAPLVHVTTHLAIAVAGGQRPYPNVDLSFRTKLFAAGVSPFFGEPGVLGTWLWSLAVPAALVVVITTARRRERDAWLFAGILVTGFLMSAVALARGPTPSWYYIPWVVAVASVALRGLAHAKLVVQLAVGLIVLSMTLLHTPSAIADWARTERSGSTAVELAKGVTTAGCPLYLANFDIEQRVAIPQLFGFVDGERIASCTGRRSTAYAVDWQARSLPPDFAAQCGGGWRTLRVQNQVSLLGCRSFREQAIPDQVAASGNPRITVVRLRPTRRAPTPDSLFQASSLP
ncbi:MAG: hypothetical protein E6G03_02205 [Actinobacteria bacterium]|nr:MAG: hypothetical protein E6G03_02205 [Actinomycetota bacterium]